MVANTVFAPRLGQAGYNWDTIAFGWDFAVVMAVYVAGGITGAHINPAVTLAAMTRRTISVGTGLLYMVAQLAGAFVGALAVWLVYQGSFVNSGFKNTFYTSPAAGYESMIFTQYLTEIIGTFLLVGGTMGAWFYDFLVRPFLPVKKSAAPELLRPETSSERAA